MLAFASERELNVLTSYAKRTSLLAAGISSELRELLSSLRYLGPLRPVPRRFYERSASSVSGDEVPIALLLFDSSIIRDQVNDWLEQLEIPYGLNVVPVRAASGDDLIGDVVAVALSDRRSGVAVTPADVGFGVSQVLPIVVELLARRESLICIEQPETHLHPRLQARLADALIESSIEGGRGNQLIVETHSEHLLLRVQRRVREGVLAADKVSVLYVDQSSNGAASVLRLRMDDNGEFIDEWPQGFFDERLDELFGSN